MNHIITWTFIVVALVVALKWLTVHHSNLANHDANLIEHHNRSAEALKHIHEDVEKSKQIALDNGKKLDILLNIATNVNNCIDTKGN